MEIQELKNNKITLFVWILKFLCTVLFSNVGKNKYRENTQAKQQQKKELMAKVCPKKSAPKQSDRPVWMLH